MQIFLLYITTVLIWGSTWFVITFQLGSVSPDLSVAYRFALAAFILFAFGFITKRINFSRFTALDHLFIAMQGAFLFCLNYWVFYIATGYLTSGLVAVSFSTIIVMNIFNQAIFFKKRVEKKTIYAALLGLAGIYLVFRPEIQTLSFESDAVVGLSFCLLATFIASLGNMAAVRNSSAGLPVSDVNALGMGYGALIMLAIAFFNGSEFTFDTSFNYLWSLFYLALLGSVLAFGCYLTLISKIGADKGAYAAVLFPIVALAISTVFESYIWTMDAMIGVGLILGGNIIVLAPKSLLNGILRRKEKAAAE